MISLLVASEGFILSKELSFVSVTSLSSEYESLEFGMRSVQGVVSHRPLASCLIEDVFL